MLALLTAQVGVALMWGAFAQVSADRYGSTAAGSNPPPQQRLNEGDRYGSPAAQGSLTPLSRDPLPRDPFQRESSSQNAAPPAPSAFQRGNTPPPSSGPAPSSQPFQGQNNTGQNNTGQGNTGQGGYRLQPLSPQGSVSPTSPQQPLTQQPALAQGSPQAQQSFQARQSFQPQQSYPTQQAPVRTQPSPPAPLYGASGSGVGSQPSAGLAPSQRLASSPANSYPTQSVAPSSANTQLGPAALMRAMLAAPQDSQLVGAPVQLQEVVQRGGSRETQSAQVDAYWDLCSAAADYYLGLRERVELSKLRTGAAASSPAMREAEQVLAMRLDTSLKAAVASQMRLAAMLGRGDRPLPVDAPFCGRYNTRFGEIFGTRPSTEAEQLRQLIPQRYNELESMAAAVGRSEQWVQRVARQDSGSADGVIQAMQLLALNRRAFVQLAKDYNRRISRYTELARPGTVDSISLVSMLIETPRSNPTGIVAGRVQQLGSGEQPAFRSPLVGQPGGGLR